GLCVLPIPFLSMLLRHPLSTLFPYTTLFRSTSVSTAARQVSMTCGPTVPHPERLCCSLWLDKRMFMWFRNPNSLANQLAEEKARSEEHTSELQSLAYLVCRLLLEKKKQNKH